MLHTMNYTKWLRYVLIGGLFLSLLIPFIIANGGLFPNMFFPFITGKNFAFRILTELMLGAYVLLALREPRYRPRFSWVFAALCGFVLWAGIATIFSVDPVKSFWSNFERMEGYVTVLHLLAYFFIASAVLTADKLWTPFFRASVAASVAMSGYGLLQLVGKIGIDQGSTRLDGTLGNAIYLAVYMLFNIFFALILLYRDRDNKTLRWLYAAAIALDAFVLFGTETRGTILGLVGGLAVACLYLVYELRRDARWDRLRRAALGGLAALVIIVGGFIAVKNTSFVQHSPALGRLASISFEDQTTKARFMIWHMAWDGFKDKPVFGWGQENFNFVFNKYYNPGMYGQEQWFDRAHDAFLDWLTAAGAPGFLLFLSLFAAAGAAIWRSRELEVPERALLLGLLAGFAFHELFVFDNIVSNLQFFALLALAHGLSQREVPARVWLARPLSEQGMSIAAPIVIAAVLAGAWWFNAGGIANAQTLITAIETVNPQTGGPADLQNNLAAFKTVLAGAPLGRQEAVEQLLQFAPQVAQSNASPALKQDFYATAVSAIEAMTAERRGDARLELFFGSFLDQFGQYAEGLKHLELAHQASPAKQQILFEMGVNNLLRSGNSAQALEVLGEAYNLDTEYDAARLYYAMALYENGRSADADALIMARYGTLSPADNGVVQMYFNSKQYSRAEASLEELVKQDPLSGQSWTELAAVHYASGDIPGAISALKRGETANPALAAQFDGLIKQVQSGK